MITHVQLMVDTANQVFANSRMNARLNLVQSVLAPFGDTPATVRPISRRSRQTAGSLL